MELACLSYLEEVIAMEKFLSFHQNKCYFILKLLRVETPKML